MITYVTESKIFFLHTLIFIARPSLSQTSPELEDLFKKILNKDPEKRITIAELKVKYTNKFKLISFIRIILGC